MQRAKVHPSALNQQLKISFTPLTATGTATLLTPHNKNASHTCSHLLGRQRAHRQAPHFVLEVPAHQLRRLRLGAQRHRVQRRKRHTSGKYVLKHLASLRTHEEARAVRGESYGADGGYGTAGGGAVAVCVFVVTVSRCCRGAGSLACEGAVQNEQPDVKSQLDEKQPHKNTVSKAYRRFEREKIRTRPTAQAHVYPGIQCKSKIYGCTYRQSWHPSWRPRGQRRVALCRSCHP
jgi:hypothetical protein